MFDFEKPNIEIAEISEDKRYGKFVVEPLERGYGTTLGNSLRRIMLSSLPGSAVSQVKIDGVLHEFSSIAGVKEDVTEIIMNIKSLAIKNNSDTNEPKTAYIEFEGEGVIHASDIQTDADIEILNPDQVIATLSGGADSKFYMELTIPFTHRLSVSICPLRTPVLVSRQTTISSHLRSTQTEHWIRMRLSALLLKF